MADYVRAESRTHEGYGVHTGKDGEVVKNQVFRVPTSVGFYAITRARLKSLL